MMKQYSIMVSDSEDVVSSALMKIMKQYKLSNMINQQVSLENLEFIINLFGAYGNEVSGTPLVAYGYNSKIFGVVLGDCYYHVRIQQPLKFIHYSTQ